MHPTLIHQWKQALLDGATNIFERGGKASAAEVDGEMVRSLQAKSGELAVANEQQVREEIFVRDKLKPGSASETWEDQAGPSCGVDQGAVPPSVDLSVVVLS